MDGPDVLNEIDSEIPTVEGMSLPYKQLVSEKLVGLHS